jgi:hypothetical protein
VTPCSFIEASICFVAKYCLNLQDLKYVNNKKVSVICGIFWAYSLIMRIEAICSSETSVNFYKFIQPEDRSSLVFLPVHRNCAFEDVSKFQN